MDGGYYFIIKSYISIILSEDIVNRKKSLMYFNQNFGKPILVLVWLIELVVKLFCRLCINIFMAMLD